MGPGWCWRSSAAGTTSHQDLCHRPSSVLARALRHLCEDGCLFAGPEASLARPPCQSSKGTLSRLSVEAGLSAAATAHLVPQLHRHTQTRTQPLADPAKSKWTSSLREVFTGKGSSGQWKILASGRALSGLFPTRFLSVEEASPSYSELWLGACKVLPQKNSRGRAVTGDGRAQREGVMVPSPHFYWLHNWFFSVVYHPLLVQRQEIFPGFSVHFFHIFLSQQCL